jgi:hypothetical protein
MGDSFAFATQPSKEEGERGGTSTNGSRFLDERRYGRKPEAKCRKMVDALGLEPRTR